MNSISKTFDNFQTSVASSAVNIEIGNKPGKETNSLTKMIVKLADKIFSAISSNYQQKREKIYNATIRPLQMPVLRNMQEVHKELKKQFEEDILANSNSQVELVEIDDDGYSTATEDSEEEILSNEELSQNSELPNVLPAPKRSFPTGKVTAGVVTTAAVVGGIFATAKGYIDPMSFIFGQKEQPTCPVQRLTIGQ